MRKIVFFLLVLLLPLSFCACSSTQVSNESIDEVNNNDNISFDVTYQDLLQEFSANAFQYSELGEQVFDDNEKLISGVIYLSDNEFEICRVKVRTFGNRLAQVHLNYDISGDEKGYDKFPDILNVVAHTIKHEIPDNYLEGLDTYSEDHYSMDYEDLRITLTFSEKHLGAGAAGTAVDCYFVHLDSVD